jgi:S-DNA-T family DNA segregation ATPase FtsK/SpoIIIE
MPSVDTLVYAVLAIVLVIGVILIYRKKEPVVIPSYPLLMDEQPEEPEPITAIPGEPVTAPIIEKPPVLSADELMAQFGAFDPRLDLSSYHFPPLDLLEDSNGDRESAIAELEENKNRIISTLSLFGIETERINANLGPAVTFYELAFPAGTRIAQIKKMEPELALSLAAGGLKVLGHIPGTGNIGIEVPRRRPDVVSLRSLFATEKFLATDMDLPITLGRSKRNELMMVDLTSLPHLLIAGATGQGKSVGINAILLSLLYKKHPSELKLVLIDVKQLELSLYRKIERHFLAKLSDESSAVISTLSQASHTLHALCIEMDQRYDLLKDASVRDVKAYNSQFINRKLPPTEGHRYLPYVVLVIDELADLVKAEHPENEAYITRLSQLGRAAGIHLILSTQCPTVGLVTGSIKANFTARVAYRLSSSTDSRTVLENGGAEQLKGNGELLFASGTEIIQGQGAYVSTAEIEKVCDFIGAQRGYAAAWLLPEVSPPRREFDPSRKDPMFEEAARLVVMHQQGSTSLIQRKLKLGYNRAGLIIDQLEVAGIVGPFEGSKAREVLIPDDYNLEQYLATIK